MTHRHEPKGISICVVIGIGVLLAVISLFFVLNISSDPPIKLTDTLTRQELSDQVKEVEKSGRIYSPDDLLGWWINSKFFRELVADFQKSTILPEKFDKMIHIAAGDATASSGDLKIAREFLRRWELLSPELEQQLENSITPQVVDVMFRNAREKRKESNEVAEIMRAMKEQRKKYQNWAYETLIRNGASHAYASEYAKTYADYRVDGFSHNTAHKKAMERAYRYR